MLEDDLDTCYSWTEKSGGQHSMGSQRIRHNRVTERTHTHTHIHTHTHTHAHNWSTAQLSNSFCVYLTEQTRNSFTNSKS